MQTSNGRHGGSTHLVPTPVMDLQHTNQDGLILCGSCGLNVSSEKLHDHRKKCYFLTEYKDVCYKDVCYPHVNVSIYTYFCSIVYPKSFGEMIIKRPSIGQWIVV